MKPREKHKKALLYIKEHSPKVRDFDYYFGDGSKQYRDLFVRWCKRNTSEKERPYIIDGRLKFPEEPVEHKSLIDRLGNQMKGYGRVIKKSCDFNYLATGFEEYRKLSTNIGEILNVNSGYTNQFIIAKSIESTQAHQ